GTAPTRDRPSGWSARSGQGHQWGLVCSPKPTPPARWRSFCQHPKSTITMKQSDNSGYEPFDRLIAGLKAEGHLAEAQRLHTILHETAWTTSSELLGELGREIVAIQQTGPACGKGLCKELKGSMRVIRRAWPTLGR